LKHLQPSPSDPEKDSFSSGRLLHRHAQRPYAAAPWPTIPAPPAIAAARKDGLLPQDPLHYVTKHLQQGIESDHFRVKRPMPRIGGFQSFHTARRTIRGFEAMLWLRKGFGFAGAWTVCEQNQLLSVCFGLPEVRVCTQNGFASQELF
jgi:hypothetical protein